ncbi:hypothetical protein FHP25_17560 [Vineibacter terrae]|uniref:DUF748 domain-containing protein n=1 Tax=Vineibacter terrae TaxID=2586908 RepID=A0A5C8PK96_9HYPH|nr:hypothetical protein [Vineibacter terrae]TXL74295.1 hypothetical protein FHP25_17560 [Vineibacter terrae]
MRWRKYVFGTVVVAALAWSAIAVAQNLLEREARAMLDAWVRSPPAPLTAFKYGNVNFDIVQRRLVVSNVELSGPDAGRIAIEQIAIVDPQPAAFDNVINPARYKDGKGQGDFVQVASLVEIRSIDMQASDGETTVAAVSTGAVALRQFAVAPTKANLSDEIAKVVGILAPGIRIAEIAISDAVHRDTSEDEGLRIARLGARGIDAGRIAEARIDDLRFLEKEDDNERDAVTIGAIIVSGIDLTRALPDMAAGRPVSGSDPARKPQVDRWALQALGGTALAAHGFSVARMGADVSRLADGRTERVSFHVEGIELAAPADADSPVARILSGLGYPALKGTIACVSDSDYARKSWKMAPCDFNVPGAGALSLTYALSGIDVSAPAGADGVDAMVQSLAAASLEWVRLIYRDEGLANRAIAHGAQAAGQPEAAFRQARAAQIRDGAQAYGAGSPRVAAVVDAVLQFLGRPGTLAVGLEPAAPVTFGSLGLGLLGDPAAAADRLGLTGSHTP